MATVESARLAEDSARTVEKAEVRKAFKFGASNYVYFSEEEQKSLREFGKPVLRIIGFKDRAQIPRWASIKKSVFIFPSEDDYVGSTRTFSALWQKLLRSKKVGIAWCVQRSNSAPRLVAVIPTRSPDDELSGTPYLPAGLWLYPLPFADDLRQIPELPAGHTPAQASEAVEDLLQKVIGQLQLPKAMYAPSKYPNPQLQWHYRILQCLALEEEIPEGEPEDLTRPKNAAIHKRCGGYLTDWSEAVRDAAIEARSQAFEPNIVKRELAGDVEDDDDRPANKRAKKVGGALPTRQAGPEKQPVSLSDAQLREMKLEKLTVQDLKGILESRSLETGGRKRDLIERLEIYLD